MNITAHRLWFLNVALALAACATAPRPSSPGNSPPGAAATLLGASDTVPADRLLAPRGAAAAVSQQGPQEGGGASTQGDDREALAKKLANPVAALISVPLQLNYDGDIGPVDDGERWVLNIQPVVPIELNDDWNLISRTILPVVWQDELYPGAGSQSGIGDIVQSVFFSPKAPTAGGWIWGAGPVLLLPTGSDDLLTADKWGAGPTAVALRQEGPWTYGALANHIWSFAGSDSRSEINNTFLQPFLAYTTPTAWTFSCNTESTYDWENEKWSVPINVAASRVLKLGSQLFSVGGGVRFWADSPDGGPEGIGFRLTFTLLFPR